MPSRYKEFYSAFPSEKQNLIEALAQTPYFNSYASDDRLYLDIKDDVSTAIKRQTNIRDYTIRQESHGYFCAGEAYTVPAITETHHEYDVGEAVLKWLNSNIVCQYNLRSEYTLNTLTSTDIPKTMPKLRSSRSVLPLLRRLKQK